MPFTTTIINGGLDLITAPQSVQPGQLISCSNFEVARLRGIRRIDGYEKYDGGGSPSFNNTTLINFGDNGFTLGNHVADFNPGALITITYSLNNMPAKTASAIVVVNSSTYFPVPNRTAVSVDFYLIGNVNFPPNSAGNVKGFITSGVVTTSFGVYGIVSVGDIFITNSAELSAITTLFNTVSPTIQSVPGQGNVNGLFWLKDKVYATRDYLSATFTGGTTQPNIGDVLYIGASLGAATFSGQVQKIVLSSGIWSSSITAGNAVGTIMFYNTTGTISNASLNNSTQAVSNISTITNSGNTSVPAQSAGLYVASGGRGNTLSTQSWQWCDLGWSIQYSNGVIEFVDMNLALTLAGNSQNIVSTEWKFASVGTLPSGWTDTTNTFPNGIGSLTGTNYLFVPFQTSTPTDVPTPQAFTVTGFGFTDADIPPTASINGIEIQINSGCIGVTGQYTNSVVDGTFNLVGVAGGPFPALQDTSTKYTITGGASDVTTGHFATYAFSIRDKGNPGGLPNPLSNLGYTGILSSDVKSAGFGLTYAPQLNPLGSLTGQKIQFGIHWLQMRVSYLPQTNGIYFWNPVTVNDGAMTSGSATLTCATSTPFTAASVGQTITIAGAGVSGATLTAKILAFTSSSIVTLTVNASTNISNASVNFGTGVIAQVVMHYKFSGDVTVGDASGTAFFNFVTNGVVGGIPSRQIGAGEQIRTYINNGMIPDGGANDGSTFISKSSGVMHMNYMDESSLLTGQLQPDGSKAPASKYKSITKDFYASIGLEAIYGVSGGGPGFYYDGIKVNASGVIVPGNFCRIHTGLPHQFDTPRSIVEHQGHIVFGYYSGVIQWSNADNTLSFNELLFDKTAGTNGFGERVTAIASVNGDTLAVWTRSTIQMIQGNFNVPSGTQTTPSLYTSTLSPTSGGIEYTVLPMQAYMYCDFRGITTLGATNKYGDFEVGHVSAIVAPFLIPRLQLSSFFESSNTGVINSVLIRNKNMVRYYFADGAALSMTYLQDGENPQFTVQNYTDQFGVPMIWDICEAFTENLGRDRIFGATSDGTGNVYELERGSSFNGGVINAYATLVPDVAQTPFQNKLFAGINVFGQAQDYAQFNLSRSADYNLTTAATGGNIITETFGSISVPPTGNISPFVSYGTSNLQLEGTAINLRFDSSSSTLFPYYIQAISYTVDELQGKIG